MPKHLKWPEGYHFFAQIDLASLPHDVTQNGVQLDLPQMSRSGTLFIFLPLSGEHLYTANAVVRYSPEATRDLPERRPPEDTPAMDWDSHFVDERLVSSCGTMLPRRHVSVEGFLSHSNVNPYPSDNTPVERHKAEMRYAEALAPYGIDYYVGSEFPFPDAIKTTPFPSRLKAVSDRAARSGNKLLDRSYDWTWQSILDVSQIVAAGFYDLAIREVADDAPTGLEGWISRKFTAKMKAQKAAILTGNHSVPTTFWHRFRFKSGGPPTADNFIDTQFEDWVANARINQDKPLTKEHEIAFQRLLKSVHENRHLDGPVQLSKLERMWYHKVQHWDIWSVLADALKDDVNPEVSSLQGRQSSIAQAINAVSEKTARKNVSRLQMFGFGECWQHAARDHHSDVLLMQIESVGGVIVNDGIVQVWISHEDLAAGRFEKTFTTMEMS